MRLTILCGSFLLLAMVKGAVVQEHSVTTEKEEDFVNNVPVKNESVTYSSEESSEEYDPYNYAPSYPYQYYGYPIINHRPYRQYPQYPQYNKPQKTSPKNAKRTAAHQRVPPQYPLYLPPYYPQIPPYQQQYPQYPPQVPPYQQQYPQYPPQVPPYQQQYPQYPPPASRYGPPSHQSGVKNPQAVGDDDVSNENCAK